MLAQHKRIGRSRWELVHHSKEAGTTPEKRFPHCMILAVHSDALPNRKGLRQSGSATASSEQTSPRRTLHASLLHRGERNGTAKKEPARPNSGEKIMGEHRHPAMEAGSLPVNCERRGDHCKTSLADGQPAPIHGACSDSLDRILAEPCEKKLPYGEHVAGRETRAAQKQAIH